MSGSNEERSPAANEAAAEPASSPTDGVELSAAEALARATEAAAKPAPAGDAEEPAPEPVAKQPDSEAPEGATDEAGSEPVGAAPDDTEAEAADGSAPEEPSAEVAAAEPTAEATDDSASTEPQTEAAAAEPTAEATNDSATTEPQAEVATEAEPEEPTAEAAGESPPAEPEVEATGADEPGEADAATVAETPAEAAESEVAAEPATEDDSEPAAGKPEAEAAAVTPAEETAEPEPDSEPAKPEAAKPEAAAAKTPAEETAKATEPELPDRPELRAVREAMADRQPLEGRVIGWNNGGFHLALGELAAFCPRSEMEVGEVQEPESYLDKTFEFRVLRLQGKGRRIVVSRAAHLRNEKSRQRNQLRKKLKPGTVLTGTVASLKDFGAFVELGGAQGLVHVSEISHRRVERPGDVLSEGQEVEVKVLKVEQGGRRISLSMRALEPDPWKDLTDQFQQGAVVKGTVEKANQIGAFIELAPGVTGLLPARAMSIPRETTPARAYPPGKEVTVQIVSVDTRRQRISLALEGSGLEGSRNDYKEYQRQSRQGGDGDGFNALASAFRRLRDDAD